MTPRTGGPSFPLRHRLFRFAWQLTWRALGRWTPVPLHGWRRFLLRCFGARIHPSAKIYPRADIWYPPNLAMDAHSCLASGVDCYCIARVTLAPFALVSQGAFLCTGTHDIDDPQFPLAAKPIHVGENAWIAAQAFVGPGVTVGEGAALGARGVAFSDLAPHTVYIGNPARPMRKRGEAQP